jgi:hypothetical protein
MVIVLSPGSIRLMIRAYCNRVTRATVRANAMKRWRFVASARLNNHLLTICLHFSPSIFGEAGGGQSGSTGKGF